MLDNFSFQASSIRGGILEGRSRRNSALPVLEWVEIEPSEEEEDASAVVVEVAEAACGGLEGLDGGVERLGHGVGDAVVEVGEQAVQVFFEREGDLLDRLKLAAPGFLIPLGEVQLRLGQARAFPEADELDAVVVGPGRAQVLPGQRLAGFQLCAAQLSRVPQPEVAAAFEPLGSEFFRLVRQPPTGQGNKAQGKERSDTALGSHAIRCKP